MKKFLTSLVVFSVLTIMTGVSFAEECDKNCTCGCRQGQECTCGKSDGTCTKDCTCGCQEGKDCSCNQAQASDETASDELAQPETKTQFSETTESSSVIEIPAQTETPAAAETSDSAAETETAKE